MKIAFVYDRINKFGGAEQVLLALHQIWPEADLYTAVYNQSTASWADVFRIHSSFLQHIPLAKTHHELFPWITPLAFESFSFSQYDVVVSITSAEAKSIVTTPDTLHICYCLTPTRYLWSGSETYRQQPGLGIFSGMSQVIFPRIRERLQRWDWYAAQRPDLYIAISSIVRDRIVSFYERDVAEIIHPPVNTDFFVPLNKTAGADAPFLIVSRFVPYKKIDIIIAACNALGAPLLVVGNGRDEQRLRRMAGKTVHIKSGSLSQEQILSYYQQCRAFLFAGEEDFGIVAAEAQACGKSVICYEKSGMRDIIIDGKTGILLKKNDVETFCSAIKAYTQKTFSSIDCRKNALRFSKKTFQTKIKRFVEENWKVYYS